MPQVSGRSGKYSGTGQVIARGIAGNILLNVGERCRQLVKGRYGGSVGCFGRQRPAAERRTENGPTLSIYESSATVEASPDLAYRHVGLRSSQSPQRKSF